VSRHPAWSRTRRDGGGFTLLEVILAVSILAVIVVLATAALRISLRAWEAGQRRADLQQESRALAELVSESLAGATAYRGRSGLSPERVLLFEGDAEEIRFVTSAPPLTLDAPVAPFHAVVLGRKGEDALRLIERLVPTDEPFAPGPERVLSRVVTRFTLAYRDEDGAWRDKWDGREEDALPTAVRVELAVAGLPQAPPALVVALPMGKQQELQ
jgi:general secretion pathway protein J